MLSGIAVIPTATGSNLTLTVDDGEGHTGSVTITTIQTQYAAWSGGAVFNADSNDDGVANGLAWLLGADNPSDNSMSLLPVVSQNAGILKLTFRCRKVTNRGSAVLSVQYSKDLGVSDPWHDATVPYENSTINNMVFDTSDDGDFINVQATIPASAASPGVRLFSRLNATSTP